MRVKKIIVVFFAFLFLLFVVAPVEAITYDLIAPQNPVQPGESLNFTIFINTESQTVSAGEIGLNYDPQYLEYVELVPGPAMDSVSATPQGTGSLLIGGANTAGFNGVEIFADINFNLIAAAGDTGQLVNLWAPPISPTPNPSLQPTHPSSIGPTLSQLTPNPTSLPKTGFDPVKNNLMFLAGALLGLTIVGFFLSKKAVF
ncbi:hypothetical protein A2774_00240 [Candidatus Roizmanbacteria bacterium RIFCSPHIGHO2_01_FULL_39_12c]|uniref:Cohesin domain-containing protein n=1 Tax=Candidatus Roizmanbacteria bacterium RIFCSPHIGHO2_01_FULL_39_12c TaxID=1802031 RepID=A0A1F7GCY0_9BACT|nr:MAG: hypothetical protein A2774_00240 [Candidatus Roizmanbacteria bacterium RIFCSPHIGHO2_01_FULL_39_12c]